MVCFLNEHFKHLVDQSLSVERKRSHNNPPGQMPISKYVVAVAGSSTGQRPSHLQWHVYFDLQIKSREYK